MCVLCGDLVGEVHWAERTLGPCSAGSSDEAQRRQARFKRARILNRVLAPYQLSMHEDLSGTRYVVGDRKGAQEVVRDLDELWTAADRLAHVPVDPLDERLLATLEGSSADR
ncbi:MAG: hypothetical protein E6I60_00565 [Chloroflexi bacterium]|nr:MAG: hypothetical protein E6I60_00565 [Chloroflexota bacterium]